MDIAKASMETQYTLAMAKVLLINPSYQGSYGSAKASIVNPIHPTLGLATIAATARERNHQVHILDMSWRQYDYGEIKAELLHFKPDIVGITATTCQEYEPDDYALAQSRQWWPAQGSGGLDSQSMPWHCRNFPDTRD